MNNRVEMVFWDVQHGHATYIKTPNDRHVVVDLGTGNYSEKNMEFSPLKYLNKNYNVRQLDYVIITHPHLDHIDDILSFDLLSPKSLLRPKQLTEDEIMDGVRDKDKAKFERYCQINKRYNISAKGGPDDPGVPDNYGGLKISSFLPKTCSHKNFNNHSIVTTFDYSGIKVVIPGDNEKCSFDELLESRVFIRAVKNADVLLAPHHGRESGFNNDFVNVVNPRLSVVSEGRYCDTSANDRYSAKSRGWVVKKSDGSKKERKCLTTNSDGEIYVAFGKTPDDSSFLSVNIK